MSNTAHAYRRPMILALGILAASAVPGLAQSLGEPLPGRKDALMPKAAPLKPERASRPCPEYGPGFVRFDGSTTCVRLGGSVRAEFGKSSRNGYGTGADARLAAEARTETSLGSIRTVISGRVRRDTGLESNSFR